MENIQRQYAEKILIQNPKKYKNNFSFVKKANNQKPPENFSGGFRQTTIC